MVFHLRVAPIRHALFELEARALCGITHHVGAIDAFALHGGQQRAAHGVGAQAAGPAHLQAQAREANGHIGLGPGCALVKAGGVLQRTGLVG